MAVDFSELLNNQTELSFTPPHGFYMITDRLPTTMFTLQRVQIPVLSGDETLQSSPLNPSGTYQPGSRMEYGVLSVDFILDKYHKNYKEVLQWFKSTYAPEDKALQASDWKDTMANITIIGTDPGNRPIMHWQFYDAFPISLDGTMFDVTMPDMEYLTSNVTFRHKYFTFGTYTDGSFNNDDI